MQGGHSSMEEVFNWLDFNDWWIIFAVEGHWTLCRLSKCRGSSSSRLLLHTHPHLCWKNSKAHFAGHSTYGNDKLDLLGSRYGSGDKANICEEEVCSESEWVTFKSCFLRDVPGCTRIFLSWSLQIHVRPTCRILMTMFPKFTQLASITLVIIAECEQYLSSLKRINSVLKIRMKAINHANNKYIRLGNFCH